MRYQSIFRKNVSMTRMRIFVNSHRIILSEEKMTRHNNADTFPISLRFGCTMESWAHAVRPYGCVGVFLKGR